MMGTTSGEVGSRKMSNQHAMPDSRRSLRTQLIMIMMTGGEHSRKCHAM